MKTTIYTSLCSLMLCMSVHAQSVGVGTTTPEPSAVLEIKSTSKGLLLPRLTRSQIKDISSPTAGLVVYNAIENKPVYYDGSFWRYYNDSMMSVVVGDHIGGGTVFYLDATGKHGLIASSIGGGFAAKSWGCFGTIIPGTGTIIGTGQANTTAIIGTTCGAANTPALFCDTLVYNGFNDWFLPSKNELSTWMYFSNSNGGFPYYSPGSVYIYWSSSQSDDITAWACKIATAYDGASIWIDPYVKSQSYLIVAVRKF